MLRRDSRPASAEDRMPPEGRSEGRPGRFSALLREPAAGPAGPRLADAATAARDEVPAATSHLTVVRDVAAGVAAPLLIGYALWLLLDARARGLKRLYFLSRDGQVLKEITEILAPRLGVAIDCRYLYASRQGWNRALGAARFDSWLWNDTAEASTADILHRLGVPPLAVAADLAALGISALDTPLDGEGAARLRAWMASERFAAVDRGAAAESRALLTDYLTQEGLFDAAPKAVVDLGWSGSQHDTLCDLLAARGHPPCPCYLFGAKVPATTSSATWSDLRRGFYFDEGRREPNVSKPPSQHALVPRDLYVVMEMFCAAPEGTLTGFSRAGRRVLPDCAPARTAALAAWGLPIVRATLHAAARNVVVEGIEAGHLLALHGVIGRLLEAFWQEPTPAEARAWGCFPWDAGQGHEADVHPLADPYAPADIPAAAWTPRRLRKREIFWVEGALAMTPPRLAAVLRGTSSLRAHLGRLRRAARLRPARVARA